MTNEEWETALKKRMTKKQQFISSIQKQLAQIKLNDEEISKEMNAVIDRQTEKIKGLEALTEIHKMLIDALEKNNKELMDAQMEHQVKVGQLEHQVEIGRAHV